MGRTEIKATSIKDASIYNIDIANDAGIEATKIATSASMRFVSETQINNWDNKAESAHTHTITNISNLQTELNNRSITGHTHNAADISGGTFSVARGGTGLSTLTTNSYIRALNASTFEQRTPAQVLSDIGAAASVHTHLISDTTGLQTALDNKSNTGHTHAISDTTGLQTELNNKSNTGHTHNAADISGGTFSVARGGTGLSTLTTNSYIRALNASTFEQRTPAQVLSDIGAAASVHTHLISDTTGLQTELNNKSNTGHTHNAADISGGTFSVARGGTGLSTLTTNSYIRALNASTFEQRTPAQVLSDIGGQASLVSGTNIKTVNGQSLLGSGDLVIAGGGSGTVANATGLTSTSPVVLGTTETLLGTITLRPSVTGSIVLVTATVDLIKDAGTTIRTTTVRVKRDGLIIGVDSVLRSTATATTPIGTSPIIIRDLPNTTNNVTYTLHGLVDAGASTAQRITFNAIEANVKGDKGDAGSAGPHTHNASDISGGTFGVDRGGTGLATLTANSYVVGNGAAAVLLRTPAQVLSDIGAAASVHTHNASDISGGTLSVVRGGTGLSTLTTNSYIRALNASTFEQRTPAQVLSDIGAAASVHTHAAGDITSGTFSVARGGTGLSTLTTNSYIRALNASTFEQRTPAQVLSDIGAAASVHTHLISDTTGLQTELNNRSITGHTHNASDISGGTFSVARGGTGLSTLTTNSYIRALNASTFEQRTPAQVLSDIGAAASVHTHDYLPSYGGNLTGDIYFDNTQTNPDPNFHVFPSKSSGFIWGISSDSAGMRVYERGRDMLEYEFWFGDNVASEDRFVFKTKPEWRGVHAHIEALAIHSGLVVENNQPFIQKGNLTVKGNASLAVQHLNSRLNTNANAVPVSIIRNNSLFSDPELNGSTLNMFVDVSSSVSGIAEPYVIKINTGGTQTTNTFNWGQQAVSYALDNVAWVGINIPVDTNWITLGSTGVKIRFNALTGGVSNETFGFMVLPTGNLIVENDIFEGGTKLVNKYALTGHTHIISNITGLQSALDSKQAGLVSGTNIKTVNGQSLLGSGNLVITGGTGSTPANVAYIDSGNTFTQTNNFLNGLNLTGTTYVSNGDLFMTGSTQMNGHYYENEGGLYTYGAFEKVTVSGDTSAERFQAETRNHFTYASGSGGGDTTTTGNEMITVEAGSTISSLQKRISVAQMNMTGDTNSQADISLYTNKDRQSNIELKTISDGSTGTLSISPTDVKFNDVSLLAGGGATIDDASVSTTKVYSSQKATDMFIPKTLTKNETINLSGYSLNTHIPIQQLTPDMSAWADVFTNHMGLTIGTTISGSSNGEYFAFGESMQYGMFDVGKPHSLYKEFDLHFNSAGSNCNVISRLYVDRENKPSINFYAGNGIDEGDFVITPTDVTFNGTSLLGGGSGGSTPANVAYVDSGNTFTKPQNFTSGLTANNLIVNIPVSSGYEANYQNTLTSGSTSIILNKGTTSETLFSDVNKVSDFSVSSKKYNIVKSPSIGFGNDGTLHGFSGGTESTSTDVYSDTYLVSKYTGQKTGGTTTQIYGGHYNELGKNYAESGFYASYKDATITRSGFTIDDTVSITALLSNGGDPVVETRIVQGNGSVAMIYYQHTISGITLSNDPYASFGENLIAGNFMRHSTSANTTTFSGLVRANIRPTISGVTGTSITTPYTPNISRADVIDVLLPNSTTTTFLAPSWGTTPVFDGKKVIFRIRQGTTGSGLITWDSVYAFSGGTPPILTTTASKTDILGFMYNLPANKWQMIAITKNF
jgi:hypothetical protein